LICGERQFYDDRRDIVSNPILIVEVLSDSTEAYDRGDKFLHYRSLPSLQAYLLFSQYRMQAELFVRQQDGTWSLSNYQAHRKPSRCASSTPSSPSPRSTTSWSCRGRRG
jgi:Uma2 family endonuclease